MYEENIRPFPRSPLNLTHTLLARILRLTTEQYLLDIPLRLHLMPDLIHELLSQIQDIRCVFPDFGTK